MVRAASCLPTGALCIGGTGMSKRGWLAIPSDDAVVHSRRMRLAGGRRAHGGRGRDSACRMKRVKTTSWSATGIRKVAGYSPYPPDDVHRGPTARTASQARGQEDTRGQQPVFSAKNPPVHVSAALPRNNVLCSTSRCSLAVRRNILRPVGLHCFPPGRHWAAE